MMQLRNMFLLLLVSLLSNIINANPKKALIFGITGQDGTYLTEFLLKKGYQVYGVRRRTSLTNTSRIDYMLQKSEYTDKLSISYGDLSDTSNIMALLQDTNPDEIYNLAAQSHIRVSFDLPEYTIDIDALGVLRILEAIRKTGKAKTIKFYQASTSEIFGKTPNIPQNELTFFHPRSPYAIAKLCAYWITVNYRESYNIFACNGILFNHESPIRGETFVTRKISLAIAKISLGLEDVLYLGNLDAKRDWGYAKDYIEAMWLMLQKEHPDDYVIATGETHTVREFIELAFKEINISIVWQGSGVDEIGYNAQTGAVLVKIDPQFFRPSEVDCTLGDITKASKDLNWRPKTSFQELVRIMVHEDIRILQESL